MADRGAQRDVMITATAPQGFETVHPIGTTASDETATFGYPRERSCRTAGQGTFG
jgi:hypothetical protein